MNKKDLEYLREMAERSETEDFSDKELEKISSALRTNVDANDTTEALDLTAQIIENQDGKNVDIEKLHDLTKEVIYYGGLLNAEDAIDRIDYFDFSMEVRKEHVTEENVNRESNSNSFLEASLYSSKSPETIKSIIDKGGKFREWEDPEDISWMLVNRLTSDYKGQLEKYSENSIKNNLGNLAVLIETGLIERPKDLDRLISNPELFEKYPDIMKKMFNYDKNLLEKLEDVKSRRENKEQNGDYLQDKLIAVRVAVKKSQTRPRKGVERKRLNPNYRIGETGEVTRKNLSEEKRPSKEEIEYGAKIQTEAAKKFMKEHRGR